MQARAPLALFLPAHCTHHRDPATQAARLHFTESVSINFRHSDEETLRSTNGQTHPCFVLSAAAHLCRLLTSPPLCIFPSSSINSPASGCCSSSHSHRAHVHSASIIPPPPLASDSFDRPSSRCSALRTHAQPMSLSDMLRAANAFTHTAVVDVIFSLDSMYSAFHEISIAPAWLETSTAWPQWCIASVESWPARHWRARHLGASTAPAPLLPSRVATNR